MRIIPRSEWGARYGRGGDASSHLPWAEVVVHTEAGAVRPGDWPEITEAARLMSLTEQQHVQAVERYHSVTLGWNGIGYSFFITRDGSIFEGRGWGRSGSHTETRNRTALGICFAGHGDVQDATGAQWAAAEWLIAEGIRLGHLTPRPRISGHRNYSTKGKSCPGHLIYPKIQRLANITATDHRTGELTMDAEAKAAFASIARRLDRQDHEIEKAILEGRKHHESTSKVLRQIRAWVRTVAELAANRLTVDAEGKLTETSRSPADLAKRADQLNK